jgi:hypothetical protein
MNERQILNFWRVLDNSSSVKDAVSALKHKKGYGGKRTLERYAQLAEGFKEGLESEVIAKKTGLGVKRIDRLRSCWKQKHQRETQDRQKPAGEISLEEQPGNKWVLRRLVRNWREEVASYSVGNLLQWWIDKTDEGASIRYYTDEDVEKLYPESRDHHAGVPRTKPLSLQVEKDPGFVLLRQKSPASDIWTLFDSWREQTIPYATALLFVLEKVRRILVREVGMPACESHEMGLVGVTLVDGIGAISSDKMCQLERRAMVLLTCDLLIAGIAELPSNSCWADLVNELRELQVRMNLGLFAVTDMTEEGSWLSRVRGIGARLAESPRELAQKFLDQLAQWQSTQDSLLTGLKYMESEI